MAETTEQYRNRINQLKTGIENEPYIQKMRENIAEGISKTGNRQADIEVRQDTLENDFVKVQQDASAASPSGAEVAVARAEFNTLDERLTTKEQQVNAQLAQKATINYVDAILMDIAKGGPRGPFNSVALLKSAYPNGAEGTWLVFDPSFTDGAHSFIWDESIPNWRDLGVYQATALQDKTVTQEKTTFIKYGSDDLFDAVTGFEPFMTGFDQTLDFIPVKTGKVYDHNAFNFLLYNKEKVKIGETGNVEGKKINFSSATAFVKPVVRSSLDKNLLFLNEVVYVLDDSFLPSREMVTVTAADPIIFDFERNTVQLSKNSRGTTITWNRGSSIIPTTSLDISNMNNGSRGVFAIYFNISEGTFRSVTLNEARTLGGYWLLLATVYPLDKKVTMIGEYKIAGETNEGNLDNIQNPDNNKSIATIEISRSISGSSEILKEVNSAKYPYYPVFGHEYLYEWYEKLMNNEPVKMVWGGDSTTQGAGIATVGYRRHELGKKILTLGGYEESLITSVNKGHQGRHTGNWLSNSLYPITENPAYDAVPEYGYLHEDMQEASDLYIIGYGLNDGSEAHWPGTTWEQRLIGFEARMREGLNRIRTNGTYPSGPSYNKTPEEMNIIISMPNSTHNTENWHDFIRPVLQRLCREYKCAFVDLSVRQYDHTYSRNWTSGADTVHPNNVANADYMSLFADLLFPYLMHK